MSAKVTGASDAFGKKGICSLEMFDKERCRNPTGSVRGETLSITKIWQSGE